MLKIKQHEVEVKTSEINFKQRMYKEQSIVTVQMMVDFFPTVIDESVVSGGLDIKLDLEDLSSIHELENKTYEGKVGYITISVNNHGTWEHLNLEEFKVAFGSIKNKKLPVSFHCQEADFELDIHMVSLYTTSSDLEKLKGVFDLNDFYKEPIESIVGGRKIHKYFIK